MLPRKFKYPARFLVEERSHARICCLSNGWYHSIQKSQSLRSGDKEERKEQNYPGALPGLLFQDQLGILLVAGNDNKIQFTAFHIQKIECCSPVTLRFSVSLAFRCSHRTQSFPVDCQCKWHVPFIGLAHKTSPKDISVLFPPLASCASEPTPALAATSWKQQNCLPLVCVRELSTTSSLKHPAWSTQNQKIIVYCVWAIRFGVNQITLIYHVLNKINTLN